MIPRFKEFIHRRTPNFQIFSNISSNIGVYAVNLLIGLWMTPTLIHRLGPSAYGLIPLANSVTFYMGLLTLSLNGAVGRFLAIDLSKKDPEAANTTFNTSFFGILGITAVALPLALLFAYFVPFIFNISSGAATSSRFLFLFVLMSFFVTEIGTSFSVSSWAKSRFDLRNRIVLTGTILQFILVILFFNFMSPDIWQVGLSFLIEAVYIIAGDILLWRKLTPELSIIPKKFDFSKIRQLFSMGGWLIIDQAGSLLLLNVDMIVANKFLGAETAGMYGSLLIFSTLLRALSSTFSGVLTPLFVSQFANNDFEGIKKLSTQSVRIMGLVLSLPVGLLCGLGGILLRLWLGNTFEALWIILILLSCHLALNLSIQPLFGIRNALNKVKTPGLVTLATGVFNFFLAIYCATRWNMAGLAIAGAISFSLRNFVFTIFYSAKIQNLPWHTYLPASLFGILGTGVVWIAGIATQLVFHPTNWIGLIFASGLVTIIYGILVILFGLTQEERMFFQKFFKNILVSNN